VPVKSLCTVQDFFSTEQENMLYCSYHPREAANDAVFVNSHQKKLTVVAVLVLSQPAYLLLF